MTIAGHIQTNRFTLDGGAVILSRHAAGVLLQSARRPRPRRVRSGAAFIKKIEGSTKPI